MSRSRPRIAALVTATMIVSGGTLLTAAPAYAIGYLVTDYTSLESAITTAGDGDEIIFQNSITATGNLPDIAADIAISGGGFLFSGDSAFRGLVVAGSSVSVSNLMIGDTTTSAVVAQPGSSISLDSVDTNSGLDAAESDVTILDSTFNDAESLITGTEIDVDIRNTSFDYSDNDGVHIEVSDGTVTLDAVTAE